jgi:dolichol-phosphate mannosyltransferase
VSARDPLSGFLLLRRSVIDGVELDPCGWKIALEVLVRGRYDRIAEVPFVFRDRTYGSSKLSSKVVIEYVRHLARLRLHLLKRGRLRR